MRGKGPGSDSSDGGSVGGSFVHSGSVSGSHTVGGNTGGIITGGMNGGKFGPIIGAKGGKTPAVRTIAGCETLGGAPRRCGAGGARRVPTGAGL